MIDSTILHSMLYFRHANQPVALGSGEFWSSSNQDESYRDTAAESLWQIIAEIDQGTPWREVVSKHYQSSHPWLHQIISSPSRDLFFRQHPLPVNSRVLDIGAGWGQIALPLAKSGAQVTALEPTPERIAFIRAAARQENTLSRMHFIEASFQDISFQPVFDLVCCIGVLEWVPKFCSGEPRTVQVDFLRHIRTTLQPGGSCYLGIENRLGLKYLLGSRDDHTGLRQVNVFHAELARSKHHKATGQELRAFTYSHSEYEELFREAGFSKIEVYAAFPDYKLPQLILPCAPPGKMNQTLLDTPIPAEHDGTNGDLLDAPEEYVSHYRSLAQMGVAQFFPPSFYFILQ